jgi:hypothetical protein
MRSRRLGVKPQQVVGDDSSEIAHESLKVHRSLKEQHQWLSA